MHSAREEPEDLTSSKSLEPGLVGAGAAAKSSDDSTSLRAQLADAQKEIARLRAQLKENEAGLGSKPVPHQAQAIEVAKGDAGVPLQTVVILVGATFFVTWSLALSPSASSSSPANARWSQAVLLKPTPAVCDRPTDRRMRELV